MTNPPPPTYPLSDESAANLLDEARRLLAQRTDRHTKADLAHDRETTLQSAVILGEALLASRNMLSVATAAIQAAHDELRDDCSCVWCSR